MPAPPLPPLPPAPAPERVAAAVAAHAAALGGAPWALDLKRSDPIFAFVTLMGAPWAIVQAMKMGGEPATTKALALSAAGLADTTSSSGIIGSRTEAIQWTWAPFERPSPMGMPANPACLSLDDAGRLVMIVLNAAKALRVETTVVGVAHEGERLEVLTLQMRVTDAAGKEAVSLRRVFTRARAA